VTVPEPMYQALLIESRKIGTFGHGFTYSGTPVAAAVALKALEIYARDRLVESGRAKDPAVSGAAPWRWGSMLWSERRGVSASSAPSSWSRTRRPSARFDPTAAVAPRAVRFAEEEGLIVRSLAGDAVSICPPLVISPAEIDELFDRLGRALDAPWIGCGASTCRKREPDQTGSNESGAGNRRRLNPTGGFAPQRSTRRHPQCEFSTTTGVPTLTRL